ncbi:integrator complex subunit 12-like [Stegodyphus dumicola]|uniref:integrator complex subunit 12-like n=1 Tax=Stegodyphus dumicola TaxID=202533 RepID=UPI0015AF181F|nr:integrator complex subunit 12-like [Stegodyphus dumicola]
MASTELDPLFVKGLRLLHSKSRESADQLKMLLDDAIAQSKQSAHVKIYTSVKMEGESKLHLKKTLREVPEISNFSSKHSIEENRERKAEKRQLEKVLI